MKILKFETEEAWREGRKARVTATRDVIGKRDKKPLIGYYQVIAESIALPPSGENMMDRGHRLEDDAVQRFAKETGKKVNTDLVILCRDDDERIAYSPDGYIGKTEDVEVKCLSSELHIEAIVTKKIPSKYMEQIIHGFVVNDKLRKRYMVFFDPLMPVDYFCIEVLRKDVEDKIEYRLESIRKALKEIDAIIIDLTF